MTNVHRFYVYMWNAVLSLVMCIYGVVCCAFGICVYMNYVVHCLYVYVCSGLSCTGYM